MKMIKKLLCLVLAVVTALGALTFVACGDGGNGEEKDYVSQLKLDFSSNTLKQEVTVKQYVDGDTTHFYPKKDSTVTGYYPFTETAGYIKARYIAINTPESTGKIEEWGFAAKDFTNEKLKNAKSIIVESDDDKWNIDSTGSRYLLWIWYMPQDGTEYKNLNVEILQNGYAVASATASNRYGEIAVAALEQAQTLKYHVYSGQKDPDFYYGDTVKLTLIELRCHIEEYVGKKVSFEGVVTCEYSKTVYVEEYDVDLDAYFGMPIYYGYNAPTGVLEALTVGNRARIVGTVEFYEAKGTYQVTGLSYRAIKPNDPNNTIKISDGHEPAYKEIDADTFASGTLRVPFDKKDGSGEIEYVELPYLEAALGSTVSMNNLTVKSVYTTNNGGNSDGAMTLTCTTSNGATVSIRTAVLYDENNQLVTADKYKGKKINVRGLVDKYENKYQIYCYRVNQIDVVG